VNFDQIQRIVNADCAFAPARSWSEPPDGEEIAKTIPVGQQWRRHREGYEPEHPTCDEWVAYRSAESFIFFIRRERASGRWVPGSFVLGREPDGYPGVERSGPAHSEPAAG
jgi:hypothetical protein